MPDLLIRNIPVELKRQIERRARETELSLSDAAKSLIETGLKGGSTPRRRLGTELFELLAPEFRSDDLVFEIPDLADEPPDFS
jgi:plasmid stability protein